MWHKCSNIGKQLFLVEMLGEDEDKRELDVIDTFAGEIKFEGVKMTP